MKLIFLSFLLVCIAAFASGQSCYGRCGDESSVAPCQCNTLCSDFGDCCSDYDTICFSCADRCLEDYLYSRPCQCNSECSDFGNCCSDYSTECDGSTGGDLDQLILDFTEELYQLDESVGQYIVVDTDVSSPLFVSVDSAAFASDTFQAFLALRDNYNREECDGEPDFDSESGEIDAFLDAVMATPLMVRTNEFCTENGLLTQPLRDEIYDIFVRLYERCTGTLSSSGFEHSFMGETDGGSVGGFHNWVTFYQEEQAGNLVYTENINFFDFSDKMDGLEMGFTWYGADKPISSMYIGTTPEFELAIYVVSYLAGTNSLREVSLNGFFHAIQTYDYGGERYAGSAYPDLSYAQ